MKGHAVKGNRKANSDHKITEPHLENHMHTKMHFSTMLCAEFLRISCADI